MASTGKHSSKVFFSVGMSLDGFLAPAGMDMAHADDPTFKDWGSQWMELQKWVFQRGPRR